MVLKRFPSKCLLGRKLDGEQLATTLGDVARGSAEREHCRSAVARWRQHSRSKPVLTPVGSPLTPSSSHGSLWVGQSGWCLLSAWVMVPFAICAAAVPHPRPALLLLQATATVAAPLHPAATTTGGCSTPHPKQMLHHPLDRRVLNRCHRTPGRSCTHKARTRQILHSLKNETET